MMRSSVNGFTGIDWSSLVNFLLKAILLSGVAIRL